jgi:hypothetical protein
LLIVGALVAAVLTVGSCGGREAAHRDAPRLEAERALGYVAADRARLPAATPVNDAAASESGVVDPLAVLVAGQPDRYLIKNATITIETEDSRATTDRIVAGLQAAGGYVSNLNEFVDGLGRRSVTIQVRVPSDRFDQTMVQLETMGKVLNKQVAAQDVTEEYVDTEARARNLKKTEERLIEHLAKSGVLEDILRVENELTRVREEIERLDGRLRFLGDRVKYSTITITVQEAPKGETIVPPQTFSTAKEFSEALRSMVGFLQGVWSRVIWMIVWGPFWLLPLVVVYVVYRRRRARR